MRILPPLNDIEYVRPLLNMVREYHRTERARALSRSSNLGALIAYLRTLDVQHSLDEINK